VVPRRPLVLWLLAFAFACVPAPAAADIYWVAGTSANRIGRATDDGRGVNTRFITGLGPVGSLAQGDGHLYWTSGTTIGRAGLDGRSVEPGFIRGIGLVGGVAVDGRFVYWLSHRDPACGNAPGFGRARLNGSGVERGFVCSRKHRTPIAVDRYASGIGVRAGHLYWGWIRGIGRVSTTGRGGYDNNFIRMPSGYTAAGVTVSNSYLYWGSYTPGPPIGRAGVTGARVAPGFINGTSGDLAPEVTVTAHYLYFVNNYFSGMTIARSTLEGVVSWDFISGLDAVGALVVGP